MATTSHELRNPLNGIISMLRLIKSEVKFTQEGRKHWKVAFNSAHLMNFLVNDILDYSKIEAGKLTLYYNNFSP
jgi:two-component system sensor histidine kinase/response regulator